MGNRIGLSKYGRRGQTRVMNVQSIAESVAQAGGTFAAVQIYAVQFYAVQNHGTVYGDPKHLYVQPGGECDTRTKVALDLIAPHRPVNSGGTT